VTRNTLYHVLQDDAQKESTEQYGNHHNFFGTITSGSGKQGYKIQFDYLPVGNQEVSILRRNMIKVKLMVLVYGWSQRGLSYFISTGRSTELHDENYLSSFKDNFGNIVYREISRPKFAHFLYDNLPLIDEANKQRQSVLNLENCWSPKDCWFKHLITLTAMSVVDMHRWHRHKTLALADAATRASNCITNIRQLDYDLRLREFSDMICVKLDKRKWNNHAQRSSRTSVVGAERDNEPLIRLRNKDGNSSRDPTTVRQIQNFELFLVPEMSERKREDSIQYNFLLLQEM
jgi:hypothetical protein